MKKRILTIVLLLALLIAFTSCGGGELKPKNPKDPSEKLAFIEDVLKYSDPSTVQVEVKVAPAVLEEEVLTSTETYTKTTAKKKSTITLNYSYEIYEEIKMVNGEQTGGSKVTKTGTVVAKEGETTGNYSYVISPKALTLANESFNGEIEVTSNGSVYTFEMTLQEGAFETVFGVETEKTIQNATLKISCDKDSYKITSMVVELELKSESVSYAPDKIDISVIYSY